jgi:hypothetical protein
MSDSLENPNQVALGTSTLETSALDEHDAVLNGHDSGPTGLHWFVVAAMSFLISATVLASYHFWLAPKPPQFGMLDMEITLKHQQQVFADLITRGKGEAAYDLATKTGPRINAAMQKLAEECACIVLVNHAVVSGVPDLTARMQQLMNVSSQGVLTK